jgi:hypothetical protein
VICSNNSMGFAIPAAQKAFQTLSIFERNAPVSIDLPAVLTNGPDWDQWSRVAHIPTWKFRRRARPGTEAHE